MSIGLRYQKVDGDPTLQASGFVMNMGLLMVVWTEEAISLIID